MSRFRTAFLAVSILAAPTLVALPALADPTTQDNGGHHGGGPLSMMPPEARMMMFVEMQKATSGMSDDQKQAYRHDQRDKFKAMSDTDKQQYIAKLEADWTALPADQKDQAKQQMKEWRAERHGGGGEMGGQNGGGGGGGQ